MESLDLCVISDMMWIKWYGPCWVCNACLVQVYVFRSTIDRSSFFFVLLSSSFLFGLFYDARTVFPFRFYRIWPMSVHHDLIFWARCFVRFLVCASPSTGRCISGSSLVSFYQYLGWRKDKQADFFGTIKTWYLIFRLFVQLRVWCVCVCLVCVHKL